MEDYVLFDQAVKLKELGFDWECDHVYYGENANHVFTSERKKLLDCFYQNANTEDWRFSAPTLAQAQKWLYEKYRFWIEVTIKAKNDFTLCIVNNFGSIKFINDKEYTDLKTPEQALSAGIDRALELLKQQNNENRN